MFSEFDRVAMTRALALAARGLETTHPNPRVGCVIARDEHIIGEGWHERAGEAHAEVVALRAAKEPVAGATAYVTLEPCSHHGRTPPCVNALIEARVARVVFAVQDPNPHVSGQGADALFRAGITVEAGLLETEATEINIGFMKRMKHGLPWVRVKLGMSLDVRTALANGASQWITSEPARDDVQHWRARSSAVMTGVGTVLADNPQLSVRAVGFKGRQPLRVVLDSWLRSPPGAKMFGALVRAERRTAGDGDAAGIAGAAGTDGAVRAARAGIDAAQLADDATAPGEVLVFTASGATTSLRGTPGNEMDVSPAALQARRAALALRGVHIEEVAAVDGFLDLGVVLRKLGELEVNEVLVEAGPTLAGQLLATSLADELLLYIAPKLIGPQGRPLVNLPELQSLQNVWGFALFDTRRFGDDLLLRLRPNERRSLALPRY